MPARLTQILDQDSQDLLLQLDVTKSYTIDGDSDITEHPVEQGANVSDHVRPKPRLVHVEGMVTNTPLPTPETAAGTEYPVDEPGPAAAAYAMLENRRKGGYLHTLVLPLDTIQFLALKRVSEPRDAKTGDALRFSLTFQEIVQVVNQTVFVSTATPQTQSKVSAGTRPSTPATPTSDQNTALRALTNFAGVTQPAPTGSGVPSGVPQ